MITEARRELPMGRASEAAHSRAADLLRQTAGLAVFFGLAYTGGILASLAATCGFRGKDRHFWQRIISALLRFWKWYSERTGIMECDLRDAAKFGDARGTIFVANHPSLMDGLMLATVIPRAVCVMRGGLRADPAFSSLSRLAGYLPGTTGSALVRTGIKRLAEGDNLIIFPEGSRSRGNTPDPFRGGFALISSLSGAPIQTLHIKFEGEYFRKGRSLFLPARFPVRLTFVAGKHHVPREGESAKALAARVEADFQSRAGGGN